MSSLKASAWRAPLLTVGVGLSAFTSGTLASLSLVTVPVILTNTANASLLASWRHTLNYGIKVSPPFAVTATLVHLLNAYLNRNSASAKYSAAAAVSTIAIVPFTVLILQPTNEELFKREQAARGTTTGLESRSVELVRKWGRVNLTRAFLPAVGALIGCLAL